MEKSSKSICSPKERIPLPMFVPSPKAISGSTPTRTESSTSENPVSSNRMSTTTSRRPACAGREVPTTNATSPRQIPASRPLIAGIVVGVLRLELHAQERLLLGLAPVHERHLALARAGIDAIQEGLVLGADRTEDDGHAQLLEGKRPVSAMQKFTTR